jgi:hypothetical protein
MTALGIVDRPLQGAVIVSPEAFVSVYDAVMKWDDQASLR